MKYPRLSLILLATLVVACCTSFVWFSTVPPIGPRQAQLALRVGNAQWQKAQLTSLTPAQLTALRQGIATRQTPFALVVMCSDSRVAPEYLFNQPIGNLFVVRTAGNVIDSVALASIEYAVNTLGIRYTVVVGHSDCGAVSATIKAVQGGTTPPGNLPSIINRIKPAAINALGQRPLPASVDSATSYINASNMSGAIFSDLANFNLVRGDTMLFDAVYINLYSGNILPWGGSSYVKP